MGCTLPALQKNFLNIFFVFAWEFCIEKWRGFLVIILWSPSPTKRSTKSPRKIRGKFGAEFGAKFGTKIRKIQETFVLRLFWPNSFCLSGVSRVGGLGECLELSEYYYDWRENPWRLEMVCHTFSFFWIQVISAVTQMLHPLTRRSKRSSEWRCRGALCYSSFNYAWILF